MGYKNASRVKRQAKKKAAREAEEAARLAALADERPVRFAGLSGASAALLARIEEAERAALSDTSLADDLHWFAVAVPAQRDMSLKIKLWKLGQRGVRGLQVWTPYEEVVRPYSKFRPNEAVRIRKPIIPRLVFVGVPMDPKGIKGEDFDAPDDWTFTQVGVLMEIKDRAAVRRAALGRLVTALREIEVVQGVIHHSGKPTYVSGRAMRLFRERHDALPGEGRGQAIMRPAQEARMPRGREYAAGDQVRFEPGSGAFSEHKGRVATIAETTCEVVLSLFGADRLVTVPLDAVGKSLS